MSCEQQSLDMLRRGYWDLGNDQPMRVLRTLNEHRFARPTDNIVRTLLFNPSRDLDALMQQAREMIPNVGMALDLGGGLDRRAMETAGRYFMDHLTLLLPRQVGESTEAKSLVSPPHQALVWDTGDDYNGLVARVKGYQARGYNGVVVWYHMVHRIMQFVDKPFQVGTFWHHLLTISWPDTLDLLWHQRFQQPVIIQNIPKILDRTGTVSLFVDELTKRDRERGHLGAYA